MTGSTGAPVAPIDLAMLHRILPVRELEWHETAEAMRLLAEVDACERSADAYSGRGWHGVAEGFSSHAAEAEMDLDDLRYAALYAIANAAGDTESQAWDDAYLAADDDLLTVKEAIQRARRSGAGDALFEKEWAA